MSKSQASALVVEFLHEVDLLQLDANAKSNVRKLIRVLAYRHDVTGIEKVDQIETARKLLSCGIDIPVIRNRLMNAYGISRATAYRIIEESIELSHKVPDFETQQASN